jgi:hypothetical protein
VTEPALCVIIVDCRCELLCGSLTPVWLFGPQKNFDVLGPVPSCDVAYDASTSMAPQKKSNAKFCCVSLHGRIIDID